MSIIEALQKISSARAAYEVTLHPPATGQDLEEFERHLQCQLPDDIKQLYRFCNGFDSTEWLFRIIPLKHILENNDLVPRTSFSFAEYMIYSDTWEIEVSPSNPNDYYITNNGLVIHRLTNSLSEFLQRFLVGGVHGEGGIYSFHTDNS